MIARRGPKYPKKGKNPWPKGKNRKTKTRRTERIRATTASGHHGPWWQPQSGRGEPHGRGGPCFPRLLVFLRVPLRLPMVLLQFCLYIAMYLDIQGPNSLHSNHLLHFHSFRLVLERKRERRRTARISYRASIERRERVLWMSFSSPSLLLSQSKFMFCYFVLNL